MRPTVRRDTTFASKMVARACSRARRRHPISGCTPTTTWRRGSSAARSTRKRRWRPGGSRCRGGSRTPCASATRSGRWRVSSLPCAPQPRTGSRERRADDSGPLRCSLDRSVKSGRRWRRRTPMSGIALDDFVAEGKRFLDANAEPRSEQKFVWGEGPDRVGILDEKTLDEEAEELRAAKDWKAREFDAGFGWITGPEEYGGRALDAAYQRAYAETQSNYAVPSVSPFAVGLGMVAPTILAHGVPEVKERYLRSLYRGDLVACQLFSEPAAGSDLAGIQTRASRDGDEWLISGQKVWTSGAHQSDLGEIITRTSVDNPNHKRPTIPVAPIRPPAVTARPLRH